MLLVRRKKEHPAVITQKLPTIERRRNLSDQYFIYLFIYSVHQPAMA